MQFWNMHNPFRSCLVMSNGYMVVWDYKNAPFLSEFNPLVREVKSGASMFYFAVVNQSTKIAKHFAIQIKDLITRNSLTQHRLAVDKIMIEVF